MSDMSALICFVDVHLARSCRRTYEPKVLADDDEWVAWNDGDAKSVLSSTPANKIRRFEHRVGIL